MRKLRIFFVELILVGVFVGWLLWKFPEAIDPFIPWILWAIFAHLTWEILLERDAVKAYVGGVVERRNTPMVWLLAFALGGLISIGYLWLAKKSVSGLASYARAHTPLPPPPPPSPIQSKQENSMIAMTDDQFKALMDSLPKANAQVPSSATPTKTNETLGDVDLNSDLKYTFYGKERLYYMYANHSRYAASKPSIFFGLMDLTNPYSYSTAVTQVCEAWRAIRKSWTVDPAVQLGPIADWQF